MTGRNIVVLARCAWLEDRCGVRGLLCREGELSSSSLQCKAAVLDECSSDTKEVSRVVWID